MEIIVRKNDLVKELHLVQGIVERKNSIPILSNVLAEARGGEVRISATDLDVSLRCGCAAQVVKEGSITLGAKKLYEIARALPESDVQIKVLPDSWATIDCERVHFKMAGLPREDYPTLPEGKRGQGRSRFRRTCCARSSAGPPSRSPRRTPATTWRGPSSCWTRRARPWWRPTATGWPTPGGRWRSS